MKNLYLFLSLTLSFLYTTSVSSQDARWGNMIYFDGTNDYMTADGVCADIAGSDWTIEMWVRPGRNVTYTEAVFAFNSPVAANRIEIGVGSSTGNKFYIYTGSSGTVYGTSTAAAGTWYHMVVTYNNSTRAINMYINGSTTAEVTRTVPAIDVVQSSDRFSLAQEWDNTVASGFFQGHIDEVRIWNSIRSNSNINDHLFREIPTGSTNLQAYFKFTNNSGSTVTDNTGNSNTGTLVNGPAWSPSTALKNSNGIVNGEQTINTNNTPADITISQAPYNNIQWEMSPDNSDWAVIPGAIGTTLTGLQTGILTTNSYYRARLDNGYGTYDYSASVMVTVLDGTLPVRWTGFSVIHHNNGALLKWQTTAELNVKDYIVEHSINGIHWNEIAIREAYDSPLDERQYSYLHSLPVRGTNYYRIRQRDTDGKSSFSRVILYTHQHKTTGTEIYPNPVQNGQTNLYLKKAGTIQLINSQGLLVRREKLATGTHRLSLHNLPSGLYILVVDHERISLLIQ